MPSKMCPYCRAVVPASEFERHKRQMHMRRRLSKHEKARIKARDGDRCTYPGCGSTKDLEIHHIDDDPTNDAPENLTTRCREHNPRGSVYWYA